MEKGYFLCVLVFPVITKIALADNINARFIKIHENATINSSEIKPFLEETVSSQTECSLLCQQNECFISQLVKNGSEHICSLYLYIPDVTASLQASESSEIFKLDVEVQKDCLSWYQKGFTQDRVYHIKIKDQTIKVFCDMTTQGGGWTVFQKRFDGSVNFHRNWHDYKNGFGEVTGEYWLGLEWIHSLTTIKPKTELLIWGKSFDAEENFAQFEGFRVESEDLKYRVTTGIATGGNYSDWFIDKHNGMFFTTYDVDNDLNDFNCASYYSGGWWFRRCHNTNLNGNYTLQQFGHSANKIQWSEWKGQKESLKETKMMIR